MTEENKAVEPQTTPEAGQAPKDDGRGDLNVALKKEREEKAELKKQLEAYQSAEAEKEKAEALKRGEHEKLLGEKENALNELTGRYASIESELKSYKKIVDSQVNNGLESIPEDRRENVKVVLKNTPVENKIDVLNEFLDAYKVKKVIDPTPPAGSKGMQGNSEFAERLEKGDIRGGIETLLKKK